MNTLLIQHILLDGEPRDILIEGSRFKSIAPRLDTVAAHTIDGSGMAIVPPFYNTHTHAAMTSMRGYADDIELFAWLQNHIWPAEKHITPDDVYHFSRLAILEMIRTGTVFFNDMYWHALATVRAVEEMGVRAAIGRMFIESSPGVVTERNARENAALEALRPTLSGRIQLTFAPHAIYTVSGQTLRTISEEARAKDAFIHIHASETEAEVADCIKAHGMTPVAWLDACGMLTPKTILAHAIHLTTDDIARIRDCRCVIAHMPCSNFKLASGQFRFHEVAEQNGCCVTIGTDGCASNNNLSMLDEMKFAALSAKGEARLPTAAPAKMVFDCATRHGAEAFGIDAGVIAEGKLADALLIDLRYPLMAPCHNLISNLVYSADSSCIDTVICDGRVLMENKAIPSERDIIAAAQDACRSLFERLVR
ncbi:MAG: amidohydrolase [Kiritimatiellaeota bacterium]|nr:amidohydrolase [Kiritimatiellota bacterium]